eukprot:4540902-Alexandrium_andersonii.AAC.1
MPEAIPAACTPYGLGDALSPVREEVVEERCADLQSLASQWTSSTEAPIDPRSGGGVLPGRVAP